MVECQESRISFSSLGIVNFGICLPLSASPFLNFFVFFFFFFPTFFSFCSFVSNYFSKHFPLFVMNQPRQPWIISLPLVLLSSTSIGAPFLAFVESLDEIPAALRVCSSLGRDFSSVFLQFPLYICVFSNYSNHSSCPSHLLARSHSAMVQHEPSRL